MYLSDLPGKNAHLKMAPEPRVITLKDEISPPPDARNSAVLVLLFPVESGSTCEEDFSEWEVVLIQRNTYEGVHSDQVAFPGGKCESQDVDYIDTACREAYEELGIERDKIKIIGQLTHLYVPPSNFTIYPVLAIAKEEIMFRLERREVVSYKRVPLKRFNPETAVTCKVEISKGEFVNAPGFIIDDYLVWGATAMILSELFHLTRHVQQVL